MQLNLPVYSYQHRSRPASPARLVNCYPELMPPGAATPVILTRSPGTKSWTTVGSGSIKGMFASHIGFASGHLTRLYVVSGRELYSVDADKNATLLGDIGTANRIDFAKSEVELVVVNQPDAYHYDGATFQQITDPDFTSRGAGGVEYIEGRFLYHEPDTNRFFGSGLGAALEFDALDFANADANPDDIVGIIEDYRSLVVFCEESTELFENTGVSGFPFERNINGTMEVGLLNPCLVGRTFDVVYFIGDDYTVRRIEGNQPMRVSTHFIEQFLRKVTISTGCTFAYELEGHFFIGFSFAEGTIIYDAVTGEWHERQSFGEQYWRPRFVVEFDGKVLAGDPLSNAIVELDLETYEDSIADQRMNSNVQVMEWTYQPIYAEGQYAFHDRLEVILETGEGTTTGQGFDPKIMMEYSDDGGETWKALPARSIGKTGKTEARAVWHNLGRARRRVYRGSVSDPVKVVLNDTLVEVRGGRL